MWGSQIATANSWDRERVIIQYLMYRCCMLHPSIQVLCGSCLDCTSKGEEGVKVIDPTQPTSSFISTPPFAFHHPSTRSSRHESIYRILEYPPDWYTYMYSYPAFISSAGYSVHGIMHICMLAVTICSLQTSDFDLPTHRLPFFMCVIYMRGMYRI